jgi:hypothetical protein
LSLAAILLIVPVRTSAQAAQPIIGRVEGPDFVIDSPADPLNVPISADSNARLLASGNRVIVRSGQARVALEGGGDITICGASRFQVIRSGSALTVVLEYGVLDLRLDAARSVSVYTPLIVATPVVIGGEATDTSVGLGQDGKMCLRAKSGAVRIEQQLSGQELLIPQTGEISLSEGQIVSLSPSSAECTCKLDESKLHAAKLRRLYQTLGTLGSPNVSAAAESKPTQPSAAASENTSSQASAPLPLQAQSARTPPVTDEPIYEVLMPPLSFDPNAPALSPDPAPDQIVLLRSVHVQAETVYQDVVLPRKKHAGNVESVDAKADAAAPPRGFFGKIGRFFHRVFNSSST